MLTYQFVLVKCDTMTGHRFCTVRWLVGWISGRLLLVVVDKIVFKISLRHFYKFQLIELLWVLHITAVPSSAALAVQLPERKHRFCGWNEARPISPVTRKHFLKWHTQNDTFSFKFSRTSGSCNSLSTPIQFSVEEGTVSFDSGCIPRNGSRESFTVCYSNSMVHYCAYTRSQLTSRQIHDCRTSTGVTVFVQRWHVWFHAEVFPLYYLSYCCVSLLVHSSFRYFLPSYWDFFFSLKFL